MADSQDGEKTEVEPSTASSLPSYLSIEPQYGTIVCTEHRTAYITSNILEHLRYSHRASKKIRDRVKGYINQQVITSEVSEPSSLSAPIFGLQIYQGWQCTVSNCYQPSSISQSLLAVEKHCSREHKLNTKRKREDCDAIAKVSIQKWFAKSNKYWIVDPSSIATQPSIITAILTQSSQSTLPFGSQISTIPSETLTDDTIGDSQSSNFLSQQFEKLQDRERDVPQILKEAEHTAELSPWQRTNRFHEHFIDIDLKTVPGAYVVPQKVEDHPSLFYICESVRRVLLQADSHLRRLHIVDAKRLNSFQVGTVRQDPLRPLQEQSSFNQYVGTFKRQICYFYRVFHEGYFDRPMFEVTEAQELAFSRVCDKVDELSRHVSSTPSLPTISPDLLFTVDSDADNEDLELLRLRTAIDSDLLRLIFTLIHHRTTVAGGFQSAIVSFCAANAWRASQTWLSENEAASLFSQVIYICQLIILAESERRYQDGEVRDTTEALRTLCDEWLHNDSKGPVGDLLRLRLYAMAVARDVVYPA